LKDWIVILAPLEHRQEVGEILHDHGVRQWSARKIGETQEAHFVTGSNETIQRIGMCFLSRRVAAPWGFPFELIDANGFV
jgi:hypothetical protein